VTRSLHQARIDLAATLRWAARRGYQQGVCNHFSLLAMSAGLPLQRVSDEVAASLASQVSVFDAYAEKHLTAIKRVLDREEPDYSS
jgi:hypothetical protein